jgi:CubicO group peptidase (beta-lactamase class C family)
MIKQLHYLSLLAISLGLIQCTSEQPVYSPEIQKKIAKVENNLCGWVITQDSTKWTLEERMSKYKTRGVSIAVINDYKIEWAKGYGWADSAERRKVTPKTLFQAASISKSLSGVGLLRLVQDKKLDLHSDVNQYLTSWKFPYDSVSKGKKITLAHLLSHTAGLSVHGFPGYAVNDSLPTLTDILDGRKPANSEAIRSQFPPGEKFQYSGGGTTVAQLIAMDISKKPYDEFMWVNVLKPLSMNNSSYSMPPDGKRASYLATGYLNDGEEVEGKFHLYPELASASLWTSPSELCNYIIDTQLSLQGKSEKVLNQEMTKLRLTPNIDNNSALGVFIDSRDSARYFHHSGGNYGFTCHYVGSMEEGKGVVVMTNSDNGAILEEIVNSVASVYQWKNYYRPVYKKVISVPEEILDTYIGKYDLTGETIIIFKENATLFVNYRGMLWKVYFTSDRDFFVMEYNAELKFQTDSEGRIVGFTLFGAVLAKKTE